jgi:hypothetical protein
LDLEMSTGVEEELGPTPKPRSRHADKLRDNTTLSDSDSDFPLGLLAVPPKPTKKIETQVGKSNSCVQ